MNLNILCPHPALAILKLWKVVTKWKYSASCLSLWFAYTGDEIFADALCVLCARVLTKQFCVTCFLLGNYLASEFYMPTFRNTLSVPSSLAPTRLWRWNRQCSKMSAYKIQTTVNYPEESIKHSEHGKSLKSRIVLCDMLPNFIDIVMLITQSVRTGMLGLFF